MKKVLAINCCSFFMCCFFFMFCGTAFAEYKIGILAKRGAEKCMQKWGAISPYLADRTGEQFKIVPLKFTAIEPAVRSGQIDFVLANSAFYVELEKKYGAQAIATLINSRKGKALKEFGGVLFVRKDSNIKKISQIKGRRFMCVKYSSFGGGHMVWRLMADNGVDPAISCSAFMEGRSHDKVVIAVKNGVVDAGTVRSDTLERMQDEGKIKISDFRILNRVKDNFPFVHSTRLYPEWPMAACPNTNSDISQKVASALKSMSQQSSAARQAKIVGWSEPLDYNPVTTCLRTIRYGYFGQ